MENKKEIEIILSSDGKMTLMFGGETFVEADQRFEKAKPLFEKMVKLMKDNDLQRKSVGGGGFPPKKEVVYGPKDCPICMLRDVKSRTIEKTSKDGTKKFLVCETAKYDFQTKQNTGCNFIEWLTPYDDTKKSA